MSWAPPELLRALELLAAPSVILTALAVSLRIAPVTLMASIGEVFAERSGVVVLGLEGLMLFGAFSGFAVASLTGDPWLGIFSAAALGILLSLLYALLVVVLGLDQAVVGLGFWLLGLGLTDVIFKALQARIPGFGSPLKNPLGGLVDQGVLERISPSPEVASLLAALSNPFVILSLAMIPTAHLILNKTLPGARLKAVGEDPRAAESLGIGVVRIRIAALAACGVLASLSGAYLSISYLNDFRVGLTAGRGFIALAMVYAGNWSPLRSSAAILLYAFVDALQLVIASNDLALARRYYFFNMIPYIFVILLLPLLGRRARPPAALMKPYRKG